MKYKNLILDFDGTLADTAAVIVETMHKAIRELGLPERSDEECRAMIGYRLEEIPSKLWHGTADLSQRYAATYRAIFNSNKSSFKVRLFPHVAATLATLSASGVAMAIASSRSRASLEEYCSEKQIGRYFQMLVGGGDVEHGKPSPEPVELVLSSLGWEKGETLVVGDMNVDILMGSRAGTATCGVTYGNGTPAELKEAGADYVISDFSQLIGIMSGVSQEIIDYVEREIVPRYAAFDKAHRESHVRMVIGQSLRLAGQLPTVDPDMAYVVAAFHDLGLANGRENHHRDSRAILEADSFVRQRFSPEQIRLMGEAVEDHRASNAQRPRNDYGLVVAEADRFIEAETIVRRTIQYGLSNYPELDRAGHYRRTLEHLGKKYGPEGYLKIWIPQSDNARNLEKLHALLSQPARIRELFDRIFNEETKPEAATN